MIHKAVVIKGPLSQQLVAGPEVVLLGALLGDCDRQRKDRLRGCDPLSPYISAPLALSRKADSAAGAEA